MQRTSNSAANRLQVSAVSYDIYLPLPADQWESSLLGQNFSMGTNYWEPKGDATFGIVGGASMTGAQNFEINNDDHSTIGTDQTVLNDVYQDALQAFLLLGF